MSIIIGADLVPTKSNVHLFEQSDALSLVGEDLKKLLQDTELCVFNLEVPLTDIEQPILKCGPNLIAPVCAVKGLSAMQANLLTLANNHILDQGVQGLHSTMNALSKEEIAFLGAGDTREQAAKPYIKEIDGKRYGFYACAEHEFSIVTDENPGANPYDPLESFEHVSSLKEQCDYVIVLYHGGKECYRYPSPNLQRTCRKFVDKGADLVVCQHSHCIGCQEKYRQGTIVYGQGNFLFDNSSSEFWQTGLFIRIKDNFDIDYIPLVKCDNTVRMAKDEKAKEILAQFHERSDEIKNTGVLEEKYSAYADQSLNGYISRASGKHGMFFAAINKMFCNVLFKRMLRKHYDCNALLPIINFVDCESHRELCMKGMMNRIRSTK